MLDLIKAQQTPQFNWYTCMTSLGANGMPDKLIKELMKQPDWIKITFEKGTKDNTGNVAPNQAWFGPEYFLAIKLPDFKLIILTQLAEAKKEEGQTLFNLMGQYFRDIGLTEWTNVFAKQCLDETHHTKENFDNCIRDYLKAVAGFPNVGNQLICWLCTTKKPAFMLHADAWIHAASSTAPQLPWQWLHPLNNEVAHSAREEWTNLLHAASL